MLALVLLLVSVKVVSNKVLFGAMQKFLRLKLKLTNAQRLLRRCTINNLPHPSFLKNHCQADQS